MMDFERFKLYWGATRRLGIFVIVFACVMMVAGLLFSHLLNELHLLGFPFGVLLLGVVVVVISIGLMFWFIGVQDSIDSQYGADDEL